MTRRSAADLFDLMTKDLGGRYPTDELKKGPYASAMHNFLVRADRRAYHLLAHEYKSKGRAIHFDVVANLELNAYAFVSPKGEDAYDFVGFHVGTLFTLADFFRRLLAHPDIFRRVGDPKKESADGICIDALYTNLFSSDVKPAKPRDTVREVYADILAKTAFDFLLWHELTHLLDGHVELSEVLYGRPLIAEATHVTGGGMSGLTSQALEMDADCSAAHRCLFEGMHFLSQFDRILHGAPPFARPAYMEAYATPKHVLFTVLVAIYTVFRLFDQTDWADSQLETLSHPPAPMRQLFIVGQLAVSARAFPQLRMTLEEFGQESTSIVLTIERAIALILGKGPELLDVPAAGKIADRPESIKHVDQVLSAWNSACAQLEVFKRGDGLPKYGLAAGNEQVS